MPLTYFLIASTTLGTSSNNANFSNIPDTYSDLLLKISSRQDISAANAKLIQISLNGLNGSNLYSATMISGNGSTVSVSRTDNPASTTSYTGVYIRGSSISTDTANTFGLTDIYIPDYLSTSPKMLSASNVTENNGTTAFTGATSGYLQVSAAVTQINIESVATFVAGSSFYLYGIKNS